LANAGSDFPVSGSFDYPRGVAFASAGHIIAADTGDHRVQVLRYSAESSTSAVVTLQWLSTP
jgi:hypothetical protein